jgi:hypothetical protein
VCFSITQQQKKRVDHGGSTGTVQNDGTLKIKNGGLKEKLLKDTSLQKQVGNTWPAQMKKKTLLY